MACPKIMQKLSYVTSSKKMPKNYSKWSGGVPKLHMSLLGEWPIWAMEMIYGNYFSNFENFLQHQIFYTT